MKRFIMNKFLNIYQLPTGYQVRIGKKTKAFNAKLTNDDALHLALSFRLEMYKNGFVPANWLVGEFLPQGIRIADRKSSSRCSIRTKEDRKPAQIEAHWSRFKDLNEVHDFLRSEYTRWCNEHNEMAKLYNQRRYDLLLAVAQKEMEQQVPILTSMTCFDVSLWNKCVAIIDSQKAITTNESNQLSAHQTETEKYVDLSDQFSVHVPNQLEKYLSPEIIQEVLDPVYDIIHKDNHASLTLTPKVKLRSNNINDMLIRLKPNRNARGAICAPFNIDTENYESFLDFTIPESWEGLPLNPSTTVINLASHNGIIQATTLLARASFLFMGYMQKQRMLQSGKSREVDFLPLKITEKNLTCAADSIYQELLSKVGRKKWDLTDKCEEALQRWDYKSVCDVYEDKFGTAVEMGGWNCFMPKVDDSNETIRRLQLLVLVSKIERNLKKIGYSDVENITENVTNEEKKSLETQMPKELVERFERLKDKIYLERSYPLVNPRSLRTPTPQKVFLAACKHCGRVPKKSFYQKNDLWFGTIQCLNHKNEAVSGKKQFEAELHELVIQWQKQNLSNFHFEETLMWGLSKLAKESLPNKLEPFLKQAKEYLSDMIEYNRLAEQLPKRISGNPGKSFMKRIYSNYLWVTFFWEAYEQKFKND